MSKIKTKNTVKDIKVLDKAASGTAHVKNAFGTAPMAYGLTGDDKYWNWFEKVHAYTFSHFSDKEYGEWYGYLHRDGTVSHTQKGSMWKGPYHLPRCLMVCEQLLGMMAEGKPVSPIL